MRRPIAGSPSTSKTTPRTLHSVTHGPQFISTSCLLCGPGVPTEELFPATHAGRARAADFSARKAHRRFHYRIVRCPTCGLVRSDPVFGPTIIEELYVESPFVYGDESAHLAAAYLKAGEAIFRQLPRTSRIIEVGCGNGFFLQALRERGWQNLVGYEPSREAIARADPRIATCVEPSMFEAASVSAASADLICFFHVLDHLLQPLAFLEICQRVLKPGGFVYGITHDLAAWPHRLWGEGSLAYDIQHIYLFDRHTIRRVLGQAGFAVQAVAPLWNTFRIGYIAQAASLPAWMQQGLRLTGLATLSLTMPVGNMSFIAQKPLS